MIVEIHQLSFRVFMCAFHPKISSFFSKSFFPFYFPIFVKFKSVKLITLAMNTPMKEVFKKRNHLNMTSLMTEVSHGLKAFPKYKVESINFLLEK